MSGLRNGKWPFVKIAMRHLMGASNLTSILSSISSVQVRLGRSNSTCDTGFSDALLVLTASRAQRCPVSPEFLAEDPG
jgi:hypothetical protein